MARAGEDKSKKTKGGQRESLKNEFFQEAHGKIVTPFGFQKTKIP